MQALHSNQVPTNPAQYAVSTRALTKRYANNLAVNSIDVDINPGELFGIVGPDGAGKTTLLQMLAGVLKPTSGTLTIFGQSVKTSRKHCGYVTQQFTLPEDLSVEENMSYAAGLRDVPKDKYLKESDRLLNMVGLTEFRTRLAGKLSGGMKEKLAIACALVASPKVVFLDEPMTGIDPVACRELQNLFVQLSGQGTAIVIATSNFDEAEICDKIAFINSGKIHQIDTANNLRKSSQLIRMKVEVSDPGLAMNTLDGEEFSQFADIYTTRNGIEILLPSNVASQMVEIVKMTLTNAGLNVGSQTLVEPTLENIFALAINKESLVEPDSLPDQPHAPTPTTAAQRPAQTKHPAGVAIHADHVIKRYGSFTAVNDVSLEVQHGEIFGLLGANGAGKTTMIQMLCGLQKRTSGDLSVLGKDPQTAARAVHARMGYMNQKFSLYDGLTVEENISFYAWCYGIGLEARRQKVSEAISQLELAPVQKRLAGHLPRGWKQRVAFAAATIHKPDILFLDEPTSGTDPITRRQIWTLTNAIAATGTAIVVTTHYLDEAEFCHRLALMAAGGIISAGSPEDIKNSCPERVISIPTKFTKETVLALSDHFNPWQLAVHPGQVRLLTGQFQTDMEQIEQILRQRSIEFNALETAPCSLEDAFVSAVERNQGTRD